MKLPAPSLPLALLLLLTSSPTASAQQGAPQPAAPPKVAVTETAGFGWRNPFANAQVATAFAAACEAQRTFAAAEYTLHDLMVPQPRGLLPWGEALKDVFAGRPFPGGWEGMDAHGYEREVVLMAYGDVPVRVREWIEAAERRQGDDGGEGNGGGRGLFAVYERPESGRVLQTVAPPASAAEADREADKSKVVIFAPGGLYAVLPLWVAEGSECEDALSDLSRYSAEPVDGGVVAWTIGHTVPKRTRGERDMEFTIKAQVLRRTGADEETTDAKDEL